MSTVLTKAIEYDIIYTVWIWVSPIIHISFIANTITIIFERM